MLVCLGVLVQYQDCLGSYETNACGSSWEPYLDYMIRTTKLCLMPSVGPQDPEHTYIHTCCGACLGSIIYS